MRFFSQFPKVPYSFDQFTPSINSSIIDMYRYIDINRDITSDLAAYLTYSIKDGERPDQVSHKLYKTPDYHWTFFIINELLKDGLQNWPKSYVELDNYIKKNYGSYSVLEFLPEQVFDEDNNLAQYNNYFGNIEFDGRIRMIRDGVDGKNLKATPVLYDHQKLQLWAEDVESSFLTNDDAIYSLIYEGSKKQKLAWAEEFGIPWCREFHPAIYKRLTNETTVVEDDIRPFVRGDIDFPETPQVFDNSERTIDMFDTKQNFDFEADSPAPSEYGWEDGFVYTDLTNDDYDEEFTFYREELTLDDVDPTQIWEQYWPEEFSRVTPERLALLRGYLINPPAELEDRRGALEEYLDRFDAAAAAEPLKAVNWNNENPVTSETDEPYKSEWYPYGTDALGVFFMEKYLQLIKFKTKRSYSESFNAPQSYADDNDTRINTYDALKADINNSNYTTYYQYENNENEAKRDIVVLRESAVEPFAERYEELLNE